MSDDFPFIVIYSLLISTGVVILYFGYRYALVYLGVKKKSSREFVRLEPFCLGGMSGQQKWVIDVPQEQEVRILIKDVDENDIHTVIDERMPSGSHVVKFDSSKLEDGTYFCEMVSDGHKVFRRIQIQNRP